MTTKKTAAADHASLVRMLRDEDFASLAARAYAVKAEVWGKRVALRGLVEVSNVCARNCLYCGIRRGNAKTARYRMDEDEILAAVAWAAENRYGSVVLQSGETDDEPSALFFERVLRRIRAELGDGIGITLSLGERHRDVYRRWLDAGANRYLLRIETSDPELFARIHPAEQSWRTRLECLRTLRDLGYVVGSGVMIGLPGQDVDSLARDIEFLRDEGVDMVGMGPYIAHPDTPLAADAPRLGREQLLDLSLRMIAAVRLAIPDANIAATTALQAIDPEGREKGLLAGANVIMPNVTATRYRADYLLYAGKPCLDENASVCRNCLERRIASIGESGVLLTSLQRDTGVSIPGRSGEDIIRELKDQIAEIRQLLFHGIIALCCMRSCGGRPARGRSVPLRVREGGLR